MTKSEIATIEKVKTCPHERFTEVSIWPLWCDRCNVFKQFIKGYRAGRAESISGLNRVSALLREGMDATGTGTLHYQKMNEALAIINEEVGY